MLAGVEVSVDAVSRSGAVAVAAGVNQVGEGACVSGTGGSEEEVLAGVEVSVDAVSRSGTVAVAAGVNQVGEGACVSGTGGSEEEVLQEWK